jgi:hypothetical protein
LEVGPISVDETPIKINAIINVFFLPTLSPKWPKIIPPIGLAINPAAKVSKDKINAVEVEASPKNTVGNIKAAEAP